MNESIYTTEACECKFTTDFATRSFHLVLFTFRRWRLLHPFLKLAEWIFNMRLTCFHRSSLSQIRCLFKSWINRHEYSVRH